MSIDVAKLERALNLFGASRPDGKSSEEFANLLGSPDEIFPWLMLRTTALPEDSPLRLALMALSKRAPRAVSARPDGLSGDGRTEFEAKRALDTAIEALVKDAIARQNVASAADVKLVELTRNTPGAATDYPQYHPMIE